MKPMSGTLRTLGFGLLAALGAVAWQVAGSFVMSPRTSLTVYALLCACAFPAALAPSLRAAALSLALCIPLAAGAALVVPDLTSAVICAALIAALGRALMYWSKPARTLALELALFAVALVAARSLGGTSPFAAALGVWSFCLVQSVYFLFLTPQPRESTAVSEDPFELAHRRALAALAAPK
jgi:hypothetical protein